MLIIEDGIQYEINERNQTATIVLLIDPKDDIIVPESICYQSKKYQVSHISEKSFSNSEIKSIFFSDDSSITTFPKELFAFSTIEKLYIPSSINELQEGWCCATPNLTEIVVSQKNKKYRVEQNKLLINQINATLCFASRDIETIDINSNIKHIAPYCFEHCKNLKNC